MSSHAHAQVKPALSPTPSFTPAPSRLLQRTCACGGTPGVDGMCESCQQKRLSGLQTKLLVNKPGDRYEQEADRISDQVMRMPDPAVQRQEVLKEEDEYEMLQMKPLAAQITPLSQRETVPQEDEDEDEDEEEALQRQTLAEEEEDEDGDDEELLQAKHAPGHAPDPSPSVAEYVHDSISSGGKPLDAGTRTYMASRFGYDFGSIRLHADSRAAELAKAVNARAFTVGRDIVFGAEQYAPHTSEGRYLIAHELTHVIQQRAAPNALRGGTTINTIGAPKIAARMTPNSSGGSSLEASQPMHLTSKDSSSERAAHAEGMRAVIGLGRSRDSARSGRGERSKALHPTLSEEIARVRREPTRALTFVESSAGQDVTTEGLRIHDDVGSRRLAARLGAVAFSVGRDIFLGADAPGPGTLAGVYLIGHEAAHAAQATSNGVELVHRATPEQVLNATRVSNELDVLVRDLFDGALEFFEADLVPEGEVDLDAAEGRELRRLFEQFKVLAQRLLESRPNSRFDLVRSTLRHLASLLRFTQNTVVPALLTGGPEASVFELDSRKALVRRLIVPELRNLRQQGARVRGQLADLADENRRTGATESAGGLSLSEDVNLLAIVVDPEAEARIQAQATARRRSFEQNEFLNRPIFGAKELGVVTTGLFVVGAVGGIAIGLAGTGGVIGGGVTGTGATGTALAETGAATAAVAKASAGTTALVEVGAVGTTLAKTGAAGAALAETAGAGTALARLLAGAMQLAMNPAVQREAAALAIAGTGTAVVVGSGVVPAETTAIAIPEPSLPAPLEPGATDLKKPEASEPIKNEEAPRKAETQDCELLPLSWPELLPLPAEEEFERTSTTVREWEGLEPRGKAQEALRKRITAEREEARRTGIITPPPEPCFDDEAHEDAGHIFDAHHIKPLYLGGEEREDNLCALAYDYHSEGHKRLDNQIEWLTSYIACGIDSAFLKNHPPYMRYIIRGKK